MRCSVWVLGLLFAVIGVMADGDNTTQPAVRILYMQSIAFKPWAGSWKTPCDDILGEGCMGGGAALSTHARALAKDADITLKVWGHDETRTALFHPEGYTLNERYWARENVSAAVLYTPNLLNARSGRTSVMSWMTAARRDILATSISWSSADRDPFDFYGNLKRDSLLQAGRWKVGILSLWGANTFRFILPLDMVVPIATRRLRDLGADVIVVLCTDEAMFWKDRGWEQLPQYDVDVVIPPYCSESGCSNQEQDVFVNNTFIAKSTDTGVVGSKDRGEAMGVIDFDQDPRGALKVRGFRGHSILEVPEELKDEDWRRDVEWVQGEINKLSGSDVVGVCDAPMPAAEVYDTEDKKVDDRCRRGPCALGVLAGEAMRARFPDVSVHIINGGALRKGWPEGNTTKQYVYDAVPFDNTLCSYNVTGPDLWRFLSKFIAVSITPTGAWSEDVLAAGYPNMNGLRYTADPTRPQGRNILSMEVKDQATGEWESVRRTRHYSLMMNNFLCSGGDDYDLVKLPGTYEIFPYTPQDLILDLLHVQRPYTPMTPESPLAINDPRESFTLPSLEAANCSETEKYDAQWEDCFPCPSGMVSDRDDATRCVEKSESDGTNTVLIIVMVVIGFLLLVLVPPVLWKWTENWRRLQQLRSTNVIATKCAQAIADMRFEEVEYIKEIDNPNPLQLAFAQIIDVLKEYRLFLPQALLVVESESDLAQPSVDCSACSTSGLVNPLATKDSVGMLGQLTPSLSVSGARQGWIDEGECVLSDTSSVLSHLSKSHGALSTHRTERLKKFNSTLKAVRGRLLAESKEFLQKRISVLWSNVNQFHRGVDAGMQVHEVGDIFECLGEVVNKSHGIIDQISGDRTVVTFGALRVNHNQKSECVRAGHSISEKLANITPSGASVGAESGIGRIGTVGCSIIRKPSCISTVMNCAYAAMRIAAWRRVKFVVGEMLYESTLADMKCRALAVLESWKLHRRRNWVVLEVLRLVEMENNEWMYQLQAGASDTDEFNERVINRVRSMEMSAGEGPSVEVAAVAESLEEEIARGQLIGTVPCHVAF
eukprot:Hpha_TRINITY_DN34406_c0_g1::TRINITY_DN34406_c0_g1_i1::g.96099::m.96099